MKQIRNKQKEFKRSLKELVNSFIQLGAVGSHGDADLSNNDLLTIHEVGGGNVPASAPISKTVEDKKTKQELKGTIQKLIKVNFNEQSGKINSEQVLNGIGLFLKNKVKAKIITGLPTTIYKHPERFSNPNRRANVPLILSGQMVDSIEYGIKK